MSSLVIHGPKLHPLGTREPGAHGLRTLAQIDADLVQIASNAGASLHTFQSNHEGALIDRRHAARSHRTGQIMGVICGLGANGNGYRLALQHLLSLRTTAVT